MNLNTAGAPAQILVNPFNFPTSPVVLNYCPCQSTEIIDRQNSSTNSVAFWVVVALLVCCFCSWFAFSLLLAAFSFIFCLLNLCWWWKIKNQAKPTPKFKKTKPHHYKSGCRRRAGGPRGGGGKPWTNKFVRRPGRGPGPKGGKPCTNKLVRRPGRRRRARARGAASPVLINLFGARAAGGGPGPEGGQALY